MSPRVVLVTGVSRYLGSRLAAELQADPSIERVIGVDRSISASAIAAGSCVSRAGAA